MQLKLLSTSLSNNPSLSNSLFIIFWIVLWLLIIEVVLYAVPYNPPTKRPNSVQRYLEYGRSVEGKIRRMIGPTDETTAPVTIVGWLDAEMHERGHNIPTHPKTPDGLLVAIYGASHAQHLSRALAKEPNVTVRFWGGPGVPPSHSYKAYQLDRGRHTAEVVIFALGAGSLIDMTTFTGLNRQFEWPLPYTFPKYHKVGDRLEEVWPSVRTMADFRQVLDDDKLWNNYVKEMQAEDSYYHPFTFHENFMDKLVIFRFIRRSWAKRHANRVKDSVYETSQGFGSNQIFSQGFKENSEVVQTLRLMLKEFARQVRSDGKLPIVVLLNIRGYSNHLTQILAEHLQEANIPFVDSHIIAPSDDPKNLAPDNLHFSKEIDQQLAQAALKIAHEHNKY